MSRNQPVAVAIRNGCKSFKGDAVEKRVNVLDNFCMTVPTGALYSLLGSRSCGKSSVLAVIVGKIKLDKGSLSVFGCDEVPVSPSRWQTISYMPQETSVYMSFSIYETFVFFAQLFNGGKSQSDFEYIKNRINVLRELLQLPNENRIVGSLSGGQKRRVSLAVALLNEPDLILLDEPTNGLDPVMRNIVWEHLKWLSFTKNVTIIVTTHCIDEAKPSSLAGMMRNGRLVAEENPLTLVRRLNVGSLEDAFLRLCTRQENSDDQEISFSVPVPHQLPGKRSNLEIEASARANRKQPFRLNLPQLENSKRRIIAFSKKNFRSYMRNLFMTVSILMWPVVYLICSTSTIRAEFEDLKIGVLNLELNNSKVCWENPSSNSTFQTEYLSCRFLQHIPLKFFELKMYDSMEKVQKAAKKGKIWGYMTFPPNYTANVEYRETIRHNGGLLSGSVLNDSDVYLNMDQTNTIVYRYVVDKLETAIKEFEIARLKESGDSERYAISSLQYIDNDFGKSTNEEFNGPGHLTYIIIMLAPIIATQIINEKKLGTVERCMSCGASWFEILMGYGLPQTVLIACQSILGYFTMHYIIDCGPSPFKKPQLVIPILVIVTFEGILGTIFGFLLGVAVGEEITAFLIIMATMFPLVGLSGAWWPLEGLPRAIQKLCYGLPLTLPLESFRTLMNRRKNLFHSHVWPGFAVLIGYITLLGLCTAGCVYRESRK